MNFFSTSINSLSEYVTDSLVAPLPPKSDTLIRERQSLLVALKICAGKVIKASSQDGEKSPLDETNFQVGALVSAAERVIFHGIKITEFYGTFPFWGLLQRMNSMYPAIPEFVQSTGEAAGAGHALLSPLALARGWVRVALNRGYLSKCMESICSQPQLGFFYHEGSLLFDQACYKITISILQSIELLDFNLVIDQDALNAIPPWLQLSFAERARAGRAVNKPGRRSSSPADMKAPVRASPTSEVLGADSRWDSIYDVMGSGPVGGSGPDTGAYLPPADGRKQKLSAESFSSRTKLFGTSLKDLVMDERRCKYALLDSHIGIPRQVHNMISVLHRAIDLPGLFRHRGSREELSVLRDALEAEQDIPAGTQVYTVAHCLLQWLYELPEPLLGFEHFESFLSCNTIESLSDRIRNFQLLVDQVLWWQIPLLVQVVNLFATAMLPCHSAKNGLSLSAVVVICTPFLLRSPHFGAISPKQNQSPSPATLCDIEASCMAISVVAGPCVEFLFHNQAVILEEIRSSYEHHVAWLEDKLERLEFVQKFAATRHLSVSDVKVYLEEKGSFPVELLDDSVSAGDGRNATAQSAVVVGKPAPKGCTRLNSVGVRVAVPPALAAEDVAILDSTAIVGALWRQLEGSHREMLERHWTVYTGVLPSPGRRDRSNLDGAVPVLAVAAEGEEDFILDDDSSVGSSNGESNDDDDDGNDDMNRVSVAKRKKTHRRNISAGIESEDGEDLLDGAYDHVRNEIDGMVRMSHSEGNLQEMTVSPTGSDGVVSDSELSQANDRDIDINPAGRYDGEDKGHVEFHTAVPHVVLEAEERRKRGDSTASDESAYCDPEVVVIRGPPAEHHNKSVDSGVVQEDDGWGERGRSLAGISILQANKQSFFSASTRDATRFESYLADADEDLEKDRVDTAREWTQRSADAPVVFPAYDMSHLLSPKSIEAYRWEICGFSGCGTGDKSKGAGRRNGGGEEEPLSGVPPPSAGLSPLVLRRHGNHQRPMHLPHTPAARREEAGHPLQIFEDHEFGSIAAELLLRFLQRFGHRADIIVCEFARKRIKYCSLSLVSCRLTQIVLWVLRLVPSSKPSHHSYGMRSSASNNNVSEWHSLFKEAAVSALESDGVSTNDYAESIQEGINQSGGSGEADYENKIFACSNTYNVKESENTDVGVDTEGVVVDTPEDGVPGGNSGEDFILDEPVELDTEDEAIEDEAGAVMGVGPDPDSSAGEGDDMFNINDLRSFSKHPSVGSSLCSGVRSAGAPQILPPKMLAQEPSWALLSSEKCIQEVFDVALLMFDDIWKYTESTEACGIQYANAELPEYKACSDSLKELLQQCSVDASSPFHFDPFNFCLDVVKTLMSELIDMKLMSVDQLWNQWTLLRMGRQELVFESKLLLKLSRLSLLRRSIESGDDLSQTIASPSAGKHFSVLATLSSLLAPGATKVGFQKSAATEPIGSDKTAAKEHSKKDVDLVDILKQSANEHYSQIDQKDDRPATPPLRIFGDSQILTTKQLKELRHKLPEQFKFADWHLRYRMSSDGASLNTLVKLSPDDETMLLVLLNSVGDVFGALVTEPWKKKMSNHFYGTGTCNVWSFHQGEELQLYPGTGVNEYYILVSEQYFAMGSGGNFAIYLDSELSSGCSGPCETYASPSLCSSDEFNCVACELYSLRSNL